MFSRTLIRHVIGSIVLFTALVTLLIVPGLAQSELQLGNLTYSRAAAPALRMPVTRSAKFFGRVGGVAFSAVARGELGQLVTALRYDAMAPDGQRLVVTVRGKDGSTHTARGALYDWQLVPTARFALDENGSAVTLFGRLQNQQLENTVLSAGHRIINYHPALDNTLLGLRLFQADILIIESDAADLFRKDGHVILGAGEAGHDVSANRSRYRHIAAWQDVQRQGGTAYQSYVVGDLEQSVTFAASHGVLTFTGEPYWNAWRRQYRAPEDRARLTALRNRYNAKVAEYNATLNALRAGTVPASAEARLDALKIELDDLEQQIEELNAVEQMPEYSRALTQQIRTLSGVNPIVYDAVRAVMHYRALFKHFQQRNPTAFSAFVSSLSTVQVQPALTTPTIQRAAFAER